MSETPNPLEARPELLAGPNPFIEPLPPFIPYTDWGTALSVRPLDNIQWKAIRPQYREALLNLAPTHFAPDRTNFDPAHGLQTLLRRAAVLRNPLTPGETKRANLVSNAGDIRLIKTSPSLDGAGAIITGITASGKSALTRRVLQCIAPEQLILHGKSTTCGWLRLEQVVWLHVDFPSNGTRGALLQRILLALDQVLGSDYSDQYSKRPNIDSLLATVCKLLSNHRVLLLVIDENQQTNFDESPWKIEFVLFYLALMNLGVSVVLAGNPLAFSFLYMLSQVKRRFSVGGIHNFEPAATLDTPWWQKDFVWRMDKFSVMDSVKIESDAREALMFKYSAGNKGLYSALTVASQQHCLRRSKDVAELLIEDIESGASSASFRELKGIASAISSISETDSPTFTDIVGSKAQSDDQPGSSDYIVPPMRPGALDPALKLIRDFKAKQTRELNACKEQLKIMATLGEDDLRLLGITGDVVANFEEMRALLERASGKGKT